MPQTTHPSAEDAHPVVFRALDAIILQVHEWLHGKEIPSAGTALDNLQIAFIIRALNQYRAVSVLLKTNHWEDALIVTRALFELVLNIEELVYRQKNQEAAAQRFFLFSELQEFQERLELRRYEIHSGRIPAEHVKELDEIERAARKFFAPFAYDDKKGKPRWRSHWANRTVADLCDLSPNKMRKHHYRILYAKGSVFTHSAPAAVLAAYHAPTSVQDFIRDVDDQEEQNMRMVASFATLFFGDILVLVGERLPGFNPQWFSETVVPIVRDIVTQRTRRP